MYQPIEILLVEDNPYDIQLTMHALSKINLGNRIKVLRDGQEALDYLFCDGDYIERQGTIPRVILLDLKLPKVDGLEVLRQIKGNSHTRKIPVVMMTASAEEQDVVRSYDLGVNSYIVKPLDFEQFSSSVRQLGMYWVLVNYST